MSLVTSYDPSQARLAELRRREQVDALFASWLHQSDASAADVVAEAVRVTVRQFGAGGCASRMAQEFGERAEACGVWGGEIFERGAIIAQKRPRGGRPGKNRQEITPA